MHAYLFLDFQDDYRVCIDNGIIRKGGKLPCPVDANGKFTDEVKDFATQHVKVRSKFDLNLPALLVFQSVACVSGTV